MKFLLKFCAILALIVVVLFALIVVGAKFSDAQIAADADTRAKREKEHAAAVAKAIEKQSVMVGMTTEEVIRAWGQPRERQRSGDASGTREFWAYSGYAIKFDNGKLVSWTETK